MEGSGTILKILLSLTFSLHLSSSDTHSLQFLYTAVKPEIYFPEFTAVGVVDGQQVVYYDSKTREMIPKTEWIQKIRDDEPYYWKRETERLIIRQDQLQDTVAGIMQNLNQNKGVHILQRMYGCELHDNNTRKYDQYGYDGEDFFSLDLNTGTWTTDKPQAEIFTKQWDSTGEKAQYWKDYLKGNCVDQLLKFLSSSHGKETLERKDPLTSSVFQKHFPSPEVVCHATGFFPKEVMISWRKDGEDVKEDVELRETLPNQDGSFQKRIILKVPAEDLQKHKYTCVIQHSSLKEEMVLEVPADQDGGLMTIIVGVQVTHVVLVVLVVAGILVWKKKNSGFKRAPSSEGHSSSCHSAYTL